MAKKKQKIAESPISPPKTAKEQKLFDNLLKSVQQFIQGRGFTHLTYADIIERLHIPEQHHELIVDILKTLVASNLISLNQGKYILKQPEENVITGLLHLHPRGFGFVKPNEPTTFLEDIFIPKHQTMNAIDGDSVEVLVNTEFVSEKGPEGRIITILNRARSHLAGIITEISRNGTSYAYAPLLGTSQKIIVETNKESSLSLGDRVVLEVLDWGTKDSPTTCKFCEHLGNISDPSCDITAAIEEYELRKDFPKKVVEEAQKFGKTVPLSEIRKREDLRSLTCFTIDPDTAKDFDDAVSLSKDEKGHYHLGVHIADVSHYVQSGSALDEEAKMRCNSTYFPGFCLPMLPRELSDNLCSLKANVNRLTVSILMEFDPEGTLANYRITRTVIKSTKRFSYREAKAVLDGTKTSPHLKTLHLMVELCKQLKKKRYERGSIEFGLPELVILVDEKGMPTKTDYVVYDITHQLIEEFMLKANETVAWHLSQQGKDLTFRVHDEPAEENLKDFSSLAAAFGFHLSSTPTPKDIQKLFDEAMDTPFGTHLATSYIRRMRLAMYSADNIGHYGLSLTHYCHFTSPIRRYVDLVVHRILFGTALDKKAIENIAGHCSEQERISAKAENSVVLLKKLRLLDRFYKENPLRQYDAIVTKIKNFGVYFEIPDIMLESYLHVSELENDYYIFDEKSMSLSGRRYGQCYKAGDKITVMLKTVNFIALESKWNLVAGPEQEPVPATKTHRKNGRSSSKKTRTSPEETHVASSKKKRSAAPSKKPPVKKVKSAAPKKIKGGSPKKKKR